MKNLIMMCGLPRSGKSTVVKENRCDEVIISADLLRLQLYGQRFYREGEALMWSINDMMFKLLLKQDCDIIIDETNVQAARRKQYIDLAKEYGYRVTCMWVNTSKAECIRRAEETKQYDVIHVIERMAEKFELPTLDEGFDEIIKF